MAAIFRSQEDQRGDDALEQRLQALEREARMASPGYETQFLNRAGNLCVEAGHPARALGYYGRAIDAYLESGRFSAAEVVCRKVLQIAPGAVRARCTLAWLAIGKGYIGEAERELESYVHAARLAGMEPLATKQLRMMAEATASAQLRQLIADYLLETGDPQGAEKVFGQVFAERNGLRAPPQPDEGKLWARLLRAALMGPQELTAQTGNGESDSEADELPALQETDDETGVSRESDDDTPHN